MIIIETLPQPTSNGMLLGKVPNGVKVTDKDTGLSVECSGHRSQHANKAQALSMLAEKLKANEAYKLAADKVIESLNRSDPEWVLSECGQALYYEAEQGTSVFELNLISKKGFYVYPKRWASPVDNKRMESAVLAFLARNPKNKLPTSWVQPVFESSPMYPEELT